jgi:hypothetical protein
VLFVARRPLEDVHLHRIGYVQHLEGLEHCVVLNTQILTQSGITLDFVPARHQRWPSHCQPVLQHLMPHSYLGRVGRRPIFPASFIVMTAAHAIVTGPSVKYPMTKLPSYGYALIAFIRVEPGFYNIPINLFSYAYPARSSCSRPMRGHVVIPLHQLASYH